MHLARFTINQSSLLGDLLLAAKESLDRTSNL
jgi:hypothetical protein